jgi:hypothetical protein
LTHVKPLLVPEDSVALMVLRLVTLLAMALLAATAAGETVYKYRQSDGRMVYSNRPLQGAELVESFEYRFTAPPAAPGEAAEPLPDAEQRIREYLAALDRAWREVQDAEQALAEAEARLSAGVEKIEGESRALGGPAAPPAPAVGGPLPPAAPAAGGPSAAAPPAIGGPLGTRRGGGVSPEFEERMRALEADVEAARARLDTALRRYRALR